MTNCACQKENGMSLFFKGLSQQIPNKRLWSPESVTPESVTPESASHVEHIFSAIFNLSLSEEVFVSFMI